MEEFRLGKEIDIDEKVLIDINSMFSLWFVFTWDTWDRLEEMDNQRVAPENICYKSGLFARALIVKS